jgi:hypothetical protein
MCVCVCVCKILNRSVECLNCVRACADASTVCVVYLVQWLRDSGASVRMLACTLAGVRWSYGVLGFLLTVAPQS